MPEVLNKDKLLEQAKTLADQGKLDRATQEYLKILQMDPKDVRIKLRVAELYVKLKKTNDAIQAYQEVANSYCDDAFYLKAVTVYKNILRLNPSLLDVNRKLAELYEKMGLTSDAIHQYQIVANMLEQKSMDDALLEVRKQIVSIAPEAPVHRVRLAEAYQICGKEDEAISEYEILVKQMEANGTPEQLIELYEKILAHRPDNLEMVRALCTTYIKLGEWKKALKRMEASHNLVLQDPDLLTQMAEFYARQNQMATAAEKFRDLADLYVSRQEVDKAITSYAASVVYVPEEEEHVKELVEQLQPNAGEELAKAIVVRREWLAKKEAEAEAETIAQAQVAQAQAVSAPATPVGRSAKPGQAPTAAPSQPAATPKVTVIDAPAKRREADAALQLADTYQQMGLVAEAKEELAKAAAALEVLSRNTTPDAVLQSRFDTIQAKLSQPQPTAAPVVKAAPQKPAPPPKKRISFV